MHFNANFKQQFSAHKKSKHFINKQAAKQVSKQASLMTLQVIQMRRSRCLDFYLFITRPVRLKSIENKSCIVACKFLCHLFHIFSP